MLYNPEKGVTELLKLKEVGPHPKPAPTNLFPRWLEVSQLLATTWLLSRDESTGTDKKKKYVCLLSFLLPPFLLCDTSIMRVTIFQGLLGKRPVFCPLDSCITQMEQ